MTDVVFMFENVKVAGRLVFEVNSAQFVHEGPITPVEGDGPLPFDIERPGIGQIELIPFDPANFTAAFSMPLRVHSSSGVSVRVGDFAGEALVVWRQPHDIRLQRTLVSGKWTRLDHIED